MKKIIIVLVVIGLIIFAKYLDFVVFSEITRAKIIQEIKVDGVDEVNKGIVTLEINGQYYDYEYEYNKDFKTVQDRINNGENISEWAKIIY